MSYTFEAMVRDAVRARHPMIVGWKDPRDECPTVLWLPTHPLPPPLTYNEWVERFGHARPAPEYHEIVAAIREGLESWRRRALPNARPVTGR